MDVLKTDDLQRLWALIQSAPIPAVALLLTVVAASATASWFLRGQFSDGKIAGLEAQLGVRDDRLKLADERAKAQIAAREDVERQFNELKVQFRPEASTATRLDALEAALARSQRASKDLEAAVVHANARISEKADSASVELIVR